MARTPRAAAKKVPTLRVVAGQAGSRSRGPRAPEAQALVEYGRTVLEAEARAVFAVSERLGGSFAEAIALLQDRPRQVVVTGMGKTGFIAQKLSATLASTGIPSIYLHPAEAAHGDLGRVGKRDVVIALSNSGATEELVRLLPYLRRIGARIIAITGEERSALARGADVVLDIGRVEEACPLGLVPTASTAALHAVGDALAMTLLKCRQFTPAQYAAFHPGGKLGRSILRVLDVMRAGEANPVVREDAPLSEVVVVMTNTPGRPGAANVVDRSGRLVGIFTDGDLRRFVERGGGDFQVPVRKVMCRKPRFVGPDELVLAATTKMREAKVDQLPVLDAEGRPVGLLDVQDLLAASTL